MQETETNERKDYIIQRRAEVARKIILSTYGSRYVEASLSSLMMAHADMEKISQWINGGKNILLYTGNPGCGKTYFCAAMINYCWPRFESCRCWTEKKLMEELRVGIENGHDYTRALSHMIDDEFLIYDDMGSTGFSEWRKEVIFELIDARYSSMKPTIITSNLSNAEIPSIYHERVWSRLSAAENTIIKVNGTDYRISPGKIK